MIDKLELTQQEIIELVQKSLSNLTFYNGIESDIHRLIGLVQDNQDFFGNPPAGQSCIKLVADKLEELIKIYRAAETNSFRVGDITLCKMCNKSIRYIGPHWEHLSGELQPRHPAWPK